MIKILEDSVNTFSHYNPLFETVYYIGNTHLLSQRKIAIVGTRHPNIYTKTMTQQLSTTLSQRQIVIVSGAAMGVDALAHQACHNYQTIAVVANGLDIRYPAINKKLITSIEQKGLMLSIFEKQHKARPYNFVQRNELVVALSEAIIITQADLNSGSLTSAKFAQKHHKPIYVLPHRLNESLGTQMLLKEGLAQPIYNIEDFCQTIAPLQNPTQNETDDLLDFCKHNPSFEQAFEKFEDRILEYELQGKIRVNNGYITVV